MSVSLDSILYTSRLRTALPLIADNKAAFNNQYAVEVFTFLQSLYTDGFFARERLSTASDPFVQQQIATKWTGPLGNSLPLQHD
jgi:hypothetical protein